MRVTLFAILFLVSHRSEQSYHCFDGTGFAGGVEKKDMIISEQVGHIVGFQYSSEDGFQFQVEAYPVGINGEWPSYFVPFNQNRPKDFYLDEFRGKRVKITVEMEEE